MCGTCRVICSAGGQAVALLELEPAVKAAGTGGREHGLQSAVPVAHLKKCYRWVNDWVFQRLLAVDCWDWRPVADRKLAWPRIPAQTPK